MYDIIIVNISQTHRVNQLHPYAEHSILKEKIMKSYIIEKCGGNILPWHAYKMTDDGAQLICQSYDLENSVHNVMSYILFHGENSTVKINFKED